LDAKDGLGGSGFSAGCGRVIMGRSSGCFADVAMASISKRVFLFIRGITPDSMFWIRSSLICSRIKARSFSLCPSSAAFLAAESKNG